MAAAAMKHMASNFAKLDKFEGVDFRIWQKKMHFLLSSMSVVYVLTTPIPDDGDDATVETIRRWQDSDKPKGSNVAGPLVVNMVECNNSSRYNDKNGKRKHHDNTKVILTRAKPTGPLINVAKLVTLKVIAKVLMLATKPMVQAQRVQWMDDDVVWWVDLGATVHVCKDRCWFKTYESLNDGSILHIGNESTALVHGRGCVDLRFSFGKIVLLFNVLHVPNIRKNFVSSSVLNHCGYKQVIKSNKFVSSKHGVFIGFGYLSNQMFRLNIVNDNIALAFMSTSKLNDSILWHARLGHVHFKRMPDMSKDGLIPDFDMDPKKCKTCMLTKITKKPFQNVKRKTEVLELIHSDLCDLHATPSLGNKKYFVTFIDDASRTESRVLREIVRLPDPKLKTLGERGVKCIFVGYVEHSKAFRFYVTEPNDSVSINSIIESRDAIFDKNRLSSVPKPSQRSLIKGIEDSSGSVVPEEEQGISNEVQDVAFWKETINNEMDFIMGNNTWVLVDLPPGCKPLGCKWIFKRKLKVDGIIKKFKARLVIQGFKQNSGIDYFDTYAPVARISTIRLLIAMASIHNLIIHQMDVNTTFLNGELEEEVYINQPRGFILPGNENKVCKLVKSLYGLKQTPKQWHQKFDEVVFSNGYLLNQADKCVYRKFNESGIGAINCLYVDDMLIFGTDQDQVNLTKVFYKGHEGVSAPMDISEKLMPSNGKVVSQLEYSRVIGCLMYVVTYTRPDIAFDVGKLSSGWVFLLGGGAISWASKKQTCITGSTLESEFVALATASKEAEWLKNLLLEIPLWSKPIAPIYIRYDSVATLTKA
ncbi:zinc finger, CCHC-type containing protein [Tanacetum coccineum]|uniref:Zinc finger, CCHC-type containing protein n=1 Tax=Tanacetum coccineum TaxID=301880 RepID=A0ABQ4WYM5_9ASTR